MLYNNNIKKNTEESTKIEGKDFRKFGIESSNEIQITIYQLELKNIIYMITKYSKIFIYYIYFQSFIVLM